VRIILKSGSLILLEPSGSVQTCSGIALPLPNNTEMEIFRIKVVSFVLYGSEIRSLILNENRRVWVIDNRLLKEIFGSKSGYMEED